MLTRKEHTAEGTSGRSPNFRRAATLWGAISLACAAPLALAGTLSVGNGEGSGNYSQGDTAYVFANPSDIVAPTEANMETWDPTPRRRIFDRWVGDTQHLEDPYSPRTAVNMPAGDVSVTAQYKEATPWAAPALLTHFPSNHQGVIFLLHGTEQCSWCLAKSPLTDAFVQEAVSRGYGVVIPSKRRAEQSTWDTELDPTENIDMQRMAEIRNDLIARGQMYHSDEVFLVGVSAGGAFASLFDETAQQSLGFPVTAVAQIISTGYVSQMPDSMVPTLIALGANDTIIPLTTGVSAHNTLINRGVAAQLVVEKPKPIHPNYFWPMEGLSAVDSQAIYASLQSGGVIDSEGFLVANPRSSGWEAHVPFPYNTAANLADMRDFMFQAYGEHAMIDSFNHRIFEFLANPVASVDIKPEIEQFAPASGPVGTQVTINGQYFVDIESVKFNGVEATFLHLVSNEIVAYVPAGVTPGPITVTNPAGTATTVANFGVEGASIESMEPSSGPVSTVVQFSGAGLVGITSVTFNGVEASFAEILPSFFTAIVPPGATTGDVVITTANGSVDAGQFTVDGAAVSSMVPAEGPPGTVVQFNGSSLVGISSVKFNGVEATFAEILPSFFTAIVPLGATAGDVEITTGTGTVNAGHFQVFPPPEVPFTSNYKQGIGSTVTIIGNYLSNTTDVILTNGSVPTSFTVISDNEVRFEVPSNAPRWSPIRIYTDSGSASAGSLRCTNC